MKIGVIGIGNMGGAILRGLSNRFDEHELYGENPVNPRVNKLKSTLGFNLVHRVDELPTDLDVVIVTVPAPITIKILAKLNVSQQTIIVSAAGGIRLDDVKAAVNQRPSVSIVPNIPVAVNSGTIGMSYDNLNDDQVKVVQSVLKRLGDLVVVDESQLSIVGTIGGCGPAFVDVFMDAMGDGAVANGLDRATAYKTISSMVKGSGQLAYDTQMSPSDLKDQVTSPGGTTIEGVNQLSAHQFRNAVIQAINAANGKM